MTNFSGVTRSGFWSWLTPERAVLVVPVLAGLGLSVVLVSVGVTPLLLQVKEQQELVDQLSAKSELLPQLRQELNDLRRQQEERQAQLDRLLALVSGTAELNTFLAQLNDLAAVHQVTINTTEPGAVERFKAPPPVPADGQNAPPAAGGGQDAPPAAGGDQASAPSSDALLNRGLEKRSATLTVTGAFQQVLAFLRSLERLETFVIISELDVKALGARRGAKDQPAMPEVSMGFKLTAYGRQPSQESDSGSDETQN